MDERLMPTPSRVTRVCPAAARKRGHEIGNEPGIGARRPPAGAPPSDERRRRYCGPAWESSRARAAAAVSGTRDGYRPRVAGQASPVSFAVNDTATSENGQA